MLHGIFVPWLPSGVEGVDLFVASSAAAIGVMDWILFQYAGLARGWGRKHEKLARVDIVFGLFPPFVLVNFIVLAVFAVLQAALPVVVFTASLAIPALLYRNRRAMRSGMSA